MHFSLNNEQETVRNMVSKFQTVKSSMTTQEAIKLLHPDTTQQAIARMEYYAGFNGREAAIKAIDEACIMACEALEKQIPKKPILQADGYDSDGELVYGTWFCPGCDANFEVEFDKHKHCPNCGQAIDWEESK